jgi:hypothetical protein
MAERIQLKRICLACRGTGCALPPAGFKGTAICPNCDGVGYVIPARCGNAAEEDPAARAVRLNLANRTTSRCGDLEAYDRWLRDLAGEADFRVAHLADILDQHGPLSREARLAVLDLANVVELLKEDLL